MRIRLSNAVLVGASLICSVLFVGCRQQDPEGSDQGTGQQADEGGQAAEFDPHDIPITEDDVERPADFKDAIARIKTYRDDIETAAGGKTPGLAHRSLDELDYVLQWLPGIARDSDIAKEHWETITAAANELREHFDKVHQNIDNKVDPDFASVARQIDAKIGALAEVTQ